MNRTLKAFVVAMILIVVGAVLAGCGLFGMNGAWDMLAGGGKLITTQETITEDFTNIDIDILRADLELFPSPDGTCYYKAETYDNMFCTAEVENGTLKIGQDDSRQWYQHIGINWGETSLKVYLPKDKYAQLVILGDTSDVVVPQGFTFENVTVTNSTGDVNLNCQVEKQVNITCSTGDVTVRDTASETFTATVSTGDIKLERVTCRSLSVRTSTGYCWIENVTVSENLSAVSGTGEKHLRNVSCNSLNMKATTGDNQLINVAVSGDAKLESSTGDWELENVTISGDAKMKSTTGCWNLDWFDAANITMITDTGDVDGTLLSDKIFFVDTDTGDVDVPQTTSGGTCEITTNTGDVKIDIAQ